MSFHDKLKQMREAARITQDELAQRAGLSRAGIAQLEGGRREPSWETVQKLAKALSVSTEAFAEELEPEEKKERGRPKKK